MKFHRADVVLIDHPFSDASGSKVRPGLVVQSDARNSLISETIIALISSNLRHLGIDPTQTLVDLSTPDGKASGLKTNSVVKCGKLFTINESLIRRRIGVMSSAIMKQIDDCLKVALDLP